MKKPMNLYTVRIVKQQVGEITIEAESEYEAERKVDAMDGDDINWDDEEWPDTDVELWKEGKWSLIYVVPYALEYLQEMAEHGDPSTKLLHEGLKKAWTEFRDNPKAADMLRAQEDQYGPFAP